MNNTKQLHDASLICYSMSTNPKKKVLVTPSQNLSQCK